MLYMYMYVTALGVLCCFALFVCLTLLASFFLPSHLSFKNMGKIPHVSYTLFKILVRSNNILRLDIIICYVV